MNILDLDNINTDDLNNKKPADAKTGLAPVFSPWDYAEEAFSETLNYMSEEELLAIDEFDNENKLREYLQQFFERT